MKLKNLFGLVILVVSLTAFGCQNKSADAAEAEATEATEEAEEAEEQAMASPPATATQTMGDLTVEINYHSPGVKGRTIWGELVPYGKVWRTGANNATTFEVNQDVTINGQALPAGKYALFTIPGETEWTFVFNTVPDQWGSMSYDESKDALRVTATPEMMDSNVERMAFRISETGKVDLEWEKLRVSFNVAAAGSES